MDFTWIRWRVALIIRFCFVGEENSESFEAVIGWYWYWFGSVDRSEVQIVITEVAVRIVARGDDLVDQMVADRLISSIDGVDLLS